MRRINITMARTAAVLLSLLTLPLFAQTADLRVSLQAPPTTRPGEQYTFKGIVENRGPDTARRVQLWLLVHGDYAPCQERLPIPDLAPGERREYECSIVVTTDRHPLYYLSVYVAVESDNDPIQGDNNFNQLVEIVTPPDLQVWGEPQEPVTPGLPYTMTVVYSNLARTRSESARITITTPTRFGALPPFCSAQGATAVCDVGPVEPTPYQMPGTERFPIEIHAPDVSGETFEVGLTIDGVEDDPNPANDTYRVVQKTYRTFFVTNVDDPGLPGSLRSAVEGANASCFDLEPCLIAFRIPPTPPARAGWFTILLQSPLPPVLVPNVVIDGTTQARYFTDSNPEGPEIHLSGAELSRGSGFVIASSCGARVRGLTITGFREYGLLLGSAECGTPLYATPRVAEGNYIGTDPTGQIAMPNERGIYLGGTRWTIRENLISGNFRSGVWVQSGINLLAGNTIGLSRDLLKPLPNGASGIFIAATASGTDVDNNFIGFNAHAGVSVDRDAINVAFNGNSFQANGSLAIDWGLDGPVSGSPVPMPEITSARVEEGETVIEGTIDPAANGTFAPRVQLYANDAPDPSGYGEGQYFLGQVMTESGRFTMRVAADLRGKWVAGTATRHVYAGWLQGPRVTANGDTGWGYYTTTSELGRAVEVR